MTRIGRHNGLIDVEGVQVGHFGDPAAACGVTVVLCPEGGVAGVDVRGAAPGTRETDLLRPLNLVEKVQAVVLSGGSVYGLATADGVVRWLGERGFGFPLDDEGHVVPIVPAAVLFDLGRGADFVPAIEAGWGRAACENVDGGRVLKGCVGAGTGAVAGGIKGGYGSASCILESGLTVAAGVAVNSFGAVVNPDNGLLWDENLEVNAEFGSLSKRPVQCPPPGAGAPGRNTTIGVIAVDACLTKAQAQKIAQMAHDGMARVIRPAHTFFDGDTLFCIGTGKKDLPAAPGFFASPFAAAVSELGRAAADCTARAIIHGIMAAQSTTYAAAFRDLPQR